jgi:PPOX class probable F420-dependent enzyme
MAKPPLPPELETFLTDAHPAVIATVQPDGSPNSVATWYIWENERVLVNMDASRKRLEWMRRDPRVSLTVVDKDDWYRHVTLHGEVVSIEDDPDLSGIDRLSRHYTGEPYARRDQPRVNAWIEARSWHGWKHGEPLN